MLAPRTVVVVNPKSQGGKLGKRWRQVAETLGRAFPFDEVMTTAQGDATRLTREALKAGAERIVAIGGDGTVNEVVNGFFENGEPVAPEASFALIPFGTGGDFRRTLVLPTSIEEAARVIAANRRKKIDVGKLSFVASDGSNATRIFANIASFGVSGVVDRLVNESGKKLGGRLSFFLASARATWSYKNQRVQLVLDGKERVDATINTVAVANGKYFGGGMMVAPAAELDDGAFEVICIGDLGFGELLASSRRLYSGTHLSMDKVSARRARVVEAEPVEPGGVVELDVDGEAPGRLPARFEMMPAALWMVVPQA
ncbi:MAG: diacylglycerol kinase family lipid kinase [Kofleriaceae bacterium]|nr:diacylglycerol kinase family lipid kinase [Kofleriaceae bacterium]